MPAATKVHPQAEADEKMGDLPSEGDHIDVELPKESVKLVNSDVIFEKGLRKAQLNFEMPKSEEEQRDELRARAKLTANDRWHFFRVSPILKRESYEI